MILLLPVLYFTAGCSNHQNQPAESPTTQLAELYDTLSAPQPGEWLYEQQELGQTLEEFRDDTPIDSDTINGTFYSYGAAIDKRTIIPYPLFPG